MDRISFYVRNNKIYIHKFSFTFSVYVPLEMNWKDVYRDRYFYKTPPPLIDSLCWKFCLFFVIILSRKSHFLSPENFQLDI